MNIIVLNLPVMKSHRQQCPNQNNTWGMIYLGCAPDNIMADIADTWELRGRIRNSPEQVAIIAA